MVCNCNVVDSSDKLEFLFSLWLLTVGGPFGWIDLLFGVIRTGIRLGVEFVTFNDLVVIWMVFDSLFNSNANEVDDFFFIQDKSGAIMGVQSGFNKMWIVEFSHAWQMITYVIKTE